jgi:hypothetical protein
MWAREGGRRWGVRSGTAGERRKSYVESCDAYFATLIAGDGTAASALFTELAGFDDHMCFARCGDETAVGILKGKDLVLYEMCRDGMPGYSLLTNRRP